MKIKIEYLSSIIIETGEVADPHRDFYFSDGTPIRPVARVSPTVIDIDDDLIPANLQLNVSWGDRVERGGYPTTWLSRDGLQIRENIPQVVIDAIRAAWLADIETRPDVMTAVEHYRQILDVIDREYRHNEQRWNRDCETIAKKFRRKWVEVGEQTVPGKCCVRSLRGKLLGYADVWDGRWMGTIEKFD